jgi:hypothetical protein
MAWADDIGDGDLNRNRAIRVFSSCRLGWFVHERGSSRCGVTGDLRGDSDSDTTTQ